MLDQIGKSHMTQGSSTFFTTDRFGNANSALALNGGWTQVPAGVYFNTLGFTISVWVYPQQIGYWSRVLDFGNGAASNNVIFSISNGNSLNPTLTAILSGNFLTFTGSSQALSLGQWQFLIASFDGSYFYVYVNGVQTSSVFVSFTPPYLTRSNCFIGKSNWADCCGDGFSSSILDELRFYNKSLTQSEILELMYQNNTLG
jgi:hypothetical protein